MKRSVFYRANTIFSCHKRALKLSIKNIAWFLFFGFALAAGAAAQSRSPSHVQYGPAVVFSAEPSVLFLTGVIEEGDFFEVRRALRENDIQYILLGSPGGSVWEALQISSTIKDQSLPVIVPEGAICASACSFIFFSGTPRAALGRIGVHQFSSSSSDAGEEIAQFTVSEIISFLNEFNTPPFVYSRMFRSDEIYILSEEENDLVSTDWAAWHFPNLPNAQNLLERALMITERPGGGEYQLPRPDIAEPLLVSAVNDVALIRLPSDRWLRLTVGDRFNGGVVVEIYGDSLYYERNGQVTEISNPDQLATLMQYAEAGVAPAQEDLAWRYLHGLGIAQNIDEAVRIFQEAVRRGQYGFLTAQYIHLLDVGRDIQRDPIEAAAILIRHIRLSNALNAPHDINYASLSSDVIRLVQQNFYERGFYNGRVDGIFGPETMDAIISYRNSGLQ